MDGARHARHGRRVVRRVWVWTWRWAEGVFGCVGERDGGEGGGQQDDGGKIMATRMAAQSERTTEPARL